MFNRLPRHSLVRIEEVFLYDVAVLARFIKQSVLKPVGFVGQSYEEHGPDGDVTIARLQRPGFPDPGSPCEVADRRVNVVEQKHVDVSAQIRTVDEVLERMRVDNWTTRVHVDVRLSVFSPRSLRYRSVVDAGRPHDNVLPRFLDEVDWFLVDLRRRFRRRKLTGGWSGGGKVDSVSQEWPCGQVACFSAIAAVMPGGAVFDTPDLDGSDDEEGERHGGPLCLEPANKPAPHHHLTASQYPAAETQAATRQFYTNPSACSSI